MATVPRTADEIDALWDYDDPPGSERRFRELLPYYAVDAAHMLAIVSSGEEQLDWNRRGPGRRISTLSRRSQHA